MKRYFKLWMDKNQWMKKMNEHNERQKKCKVRKDHRERERECKQLKKELQLRKLQRNCKITASAFILFFFLYCNTIVSWWGLLNYSLSFNDPWCPFVVSFNSYTFVKVFFFYFIIFCNCFLCFLLRIKGFFIQLFIFYKKKKNYL